MADRLDSIEITNPTSEDFTQRFNGEPYTIASKETKSYPGPLSFHIAKHLSTKMVQDDEKKTFTKKDREDPNSRKHLKVAQLSTYDTHERRIALYKILGDKDLVLECIKRYPFKGFIGEMSVYEDFVQKKAKPESKSVEVTTKPKDNFDEVIENAVS